MIYGVVLAGGTGSRMAAGRPKQFLEFAGRPVIAHATESFVRCERIDRVLVVTPEEWIDYTRELLGKFFPGCEIGVTAGGGTRNESLMNAIGYIEAQGGLDAETVIVTHDAARPFVTEEMICRNIEAVERTGACITAFPSTDTIVVSGDGKLVDEVPDRSELYQVQTPQSFRAMKLRELYEALTDEQRSVLTDAGKIYVVSCEPVEIVTGAADNIKITYPGDIGIAEAIYSGRNCEDAD